MSRSAGGGVRTQGGAVRAGLAWCGPVWAGAVWARVAWDGAVRGGRTEGGARVGAHAGTGRKEAIMELRSSDCRASAGSAAVARRPSRWAARASGSLARRRS
jgi:hypothetical protein